MKGQILCLLACVCMCTGVQTAQAQEYAIDMYDFNEKAYRTPSGKLVSNMFSVKKELYLNCENVGFSFFVYDKKGISEILEDKDSGIMLITDTLPKIEATTKSKGKIMPSKTTNEITIIPDALGKFTFTVTATVKGKKIVQNFVFEVMPIPPVMVICIDENGKFLNADESIDMPNKMQLIATHNCVSDFRSRCPNNKLKMVSYNITHAKGPTPLGKLNSMGIVNLSNWKEKVKPKEDRLVITQMIIEVVNSKGETVSKANSFNKFMSFDIK